MFVTDVRHFLDLPEDAPGPARNLAAHLSDVVRAATAGTAGLTWETALVCHRRPARQRCQGHIEVFRADLPAPIQWRCTVCSDEGVISGWEGTHLDLRLPRGHRRTHQSGEVVIADEVCAALRDLQLLDTDCQRFIYQARATERGVALPADADELDELMGCVAAEANHEPNRRRQKRLDHAFAALAEALKAIDA